MRFVATDQNVLGRVLLPEHQRLKGNQQFLCRGSFRTLQRTPLSLFCPWKNGTEPDFYAVAQAPLSKYPAASARSSRNLICDPWASNSRSGYEPRKSTARSDPAQNYSEQADSRKYPSPNEKMLGKEPRIFFEFQD